jgi:SMC interacting uncharacterized protein involved in chromosome segregation
MTEKEINAKFKALESKTNKYIKLLERHDKTIKSQTEVIKKLKLEIRRLDGVSRHLRQSINDVYTDLRRDY